MLLEKFLKNGKNKTMLISFLKDNLREYGFIIFEAPAGAGTLIAKVAVQETRNGSDAVVHADNVDILCLLMHHCKDVLGEVFFQTFKNSVIGCKQTLLLFSRDDIFFSRSVLFFSGSVPFFNVQTSFEILRYLLGA